MLKRIRSEIAEMHPSDANLIYISDRITDALNVLDTPCEAPGLRLVTANREAGETKQDLGQVLAFDRPDS